MSSKISISLLLFYITLTTASFTQAAQKADAAANENAMSNSQAAILGVVEGLTEYLPVSSTGHLLVTQKIMGIGEGPEEDSKEAADAYAICIQIGAIIAVLGLYFRRVLQMIEGLLGRNRQGLQLLINIIAGFVPAAVIGLLLNKLIKAYLFGAWPVVAAWLVGGLAILAVCRRNKNTSQGTKALPLDELTWRMALVIGFAQCIAMWPGVSRSLLTIVGGLLVGLSLPAAVEFSFLLGVVTLSAATFYDAYKHGHAMLHAFTPQSLVIGLIFAFLSAVVSIKWMVAYLNRHGLEIFGYYRVAISLVVGVLLALQVI